MDELARLQHALKAHVTRLPAEERALLRQQAAAGHEYLLAIRDGTVGDRRCPVPHELLLVHSHLHDDPDGLIESRLGPESRVTHVGHDGAVYFGDRQYDSTDVRWAYCLFAWDETGPTAPFVEAPVEVEIPDAATIALLGDWGGANPAAAAVAAAASALSPDYFIHLGDVYYAGTNQSGYIEQDYQQEHFLKTWPGAAGKSFNLNSNHDMYAHARGLFETALTSDLFSAQEGCSYFALYNSHFRVVGLDSAYFDPDQSGVGFMKGQLNAAQWTFLRGQATAAARSGQHLVVLSHHNGLAIDGTVSTSDTRLWNQVTTAVAPLAGQAVTWYCGHEHVGAVYAPVTVGGVAIQTRVCGHGCIPWGIASDLVTAKEAGAVAWFEDQVLGPGDNYFVANGFATLQLDGPTMVESFYGQTTGEAPHWSSQ